ncbi:transglutaminase domain-containing protein [Candidatus Woesearchaeota archaeon]|nr:transglutaminase domain-containing protein [Candidatus Woesearchaeota archaeon]
MIIVSSLGYVFLTSKKIDTYQESSIGLVVEVNVRNLGSYPAINVPLRLAIPTNQENHQYVKQIIYLEEPEKITEDYLGNKFVHYTIEQINAFSSKNLTINLSLLMKSTDYNIQKDKLENYDDISEELYESSLINYKEDEIQLLARQISSNSSNIVDIAWNSYVWVIQNINYQQIPGEWDALTTLRNKEGGSAELGNLYVALLKANNIPARRISGWGKKFVVGETYQLSTFAHGWAEFYLPGYGWVPVDPTWGKNHRFDYFAKTYSSHIIMTKGAGIHFMKRGPFTKPYGETEIKTDYSITINEYSNKNLSLKRAILRNIIYIAPTMFLLFLLYKKINQRKIHE